MSETATKKQSRQQQVIEAAAKLAAPGEPLTVNDIAKELGMHPANVHKIVRDLRANGLWSHPSPRAVAAVDLDQLALETKAIRDICSRLAELPDPPSRKRVLDYVRKTGGGAN